MADDTSSGTPPAQPPAPPPPPAPPVDNDEPRGSAVDPALFRKTKAELKETKAELERQRAEWQRLNGELEALRGVQGDADNYRAFLEEQRDELIASVPEAARKDLLDAVTGLSPLQQVRQVRALIKLSGLTSASPKPPPAVDRSAPANAPRTYAEWERLPRELRKSYDPTQLPD